MGHVVMTSELSGVPEHDVLCIEETEDPKRAAIFAYARKVSREPASVTREDVDALRPYLTDVQIVELVFAVCRFSTMNRLADAFGVPLEKENVFAPPAKRKGGAGGTKPKKMPEAGTLGSGGLEGAVVAVRDERVAVSVGSADKVRVGDVFDLSRGDRYVGRIKIESVDRNTSVGTFEEVSTGAPAQIGDKATLSSRQ